MDLSPFKKKTNKSKTKQKNLFHQLKMNSNAYVQCPSKETKEAKILFLHLATVRGYSIACAILFGSPEIVS